MECESIHKVNKIGVVLRPHTPSLKDAFVFFTQIARDFGIETRLEKVSAEMIGTNRGFAFDELCAWSDILVSIGGDGTLISLIRHSIGYNKPIFGVNMGRLGFLTAIKLTPTKIDELRDFLAQIKKGDYALYPHLLLKGEIVGGESKGDLGGDSLNCDSMNQGVILCDSKRDSTNRNKSPQNATIRRDSKRDSQPTKTLHCVNEFLIFKQNISGMISIESRINGKYFNTYRSDGLIIGTPTGSSAYNISAGGPIVYPYNRNILLTPVCAHSLTQKPLILNDEFSLEFSVLEGNAKIIIDGQDIIDFEKGAKFCVSALNQNALLIYDKGRDYFAVLREKFGWGD